MFRGMQECFWVALKLGVTSFGGPVAHIGYFREVYVERLQWLKEERFAELMALTQLLPGPASSQLGAAIGYERAGWLGALGAWLGFTLPSALVLIVFALGMGSLEALVGGGWLHGLKLVAVAVVAVALLGMRRALCPRWPEALLAVLALGVLCIIPKAWMQPVVILLGGLLGMLVFKESSSCEIVIQDDGRMPMRGVVVALIVLVVLLLIPFGFSENRDIQGLGNLLRGGALVFGGGHVVLPLLETSTVDSGMVQEDTFFAGYGAAQAVPGPLFTFASFLGASMRLFGNGWIGGVVGTVAIFLPGMVLLAGGVPIWNRLKHFAWARAGVRGANAVVVGLLASALLGMLQSKSVGGIADLSFIVIIGLVVYFKWLPVWVLVIVAALIGGLL